MKPEKKEVHQPVQAPEPGIRIVQTVTELFYRFGIRSITMDDVARHLSVSKKTLYRHFKDKNDMVFQCCDLDVKQRLAAFDMISDQASNPVEELMLMMRYLENMFSTINPNLLFDVKRYHPEAWLRYREFKEKDMLNKIERNIRMGIELGLYRKDINVKVLARLRAEEVELGFNPEIYPHGKFRISEVQLALFDHFMHGITTIKGHKLINRYKEIHEDEH